MNDILRNIAAIIFYTLFFIWLFLKMRNVIIVNKLKCKEDYKEIKRNKKGKGQKILKIIMITILVVIVIYLIGAFLFAVMALFMGFITLGGTAYIDTGADSSFYNFVMGNIGNYFTGFKYIMYVLYMYVYILLVNGIYLDNLNYKELRRKKKT